MNDDLVKRLRGEGLWFTEDAADEIERLRDALASAASWIDRWCDHVGNCSGDDMTCTCGRSALVYEMNAALAPAQEKTND